MDINDETGLQAAEQNGNEKPFSWLFAMLPAFRRLGRWTDLALVLCLTCVVYLNSLPNGFHFYDQHTVIDNSAIRHITDLGAIVRCWPSRPVYTFSLAINYTLGGLNPVGYNLMNLLLHLIAAMLVYALVKTMVAGSNGQSPHRFMPAFTALLFALHPVHTQTVNYISARPTLLVTVFYLAAVVLFALWSNLDGQHRTRWPALAGTYICFALAMASKEIAVTLPATVLLYDFAVVAKCNVRKLGRRWAVHVPLWLTGAAAIAGFKWFAVALDFSPARSVWSNLLTQFEVTCRYLRLMVVPYGLNIHHSVPVSAGIVSVETATSLATIVMLVVAAAALLKRQPISGYAVLWFFLTLAPAASVIPLALLMNETRLYLPGVGFALAGGYLFTRMLPKGVRKWRDAMQSVAGIGVVLVGLLYGAGTAYRNTVWNDEYSLWSDSFGKGSSDYVTLVNLAEAGANRAMFYRALDLYRNAAAIEPKDARAYAGMGDVHMAMGYMDKAVKDYRRAVAAAPTNAEFYVKLATALEQSGNIEESRETTARAIELAPDNPDVLYMQGRTLFADGMMEQAQDLFERAVYLRPERSGYHDHLGLVYVKLGDMASDLAEKSPWYRKALMAHKRAVELDPASADAHYNMANAYARLGRVNEAIAAYEMCIQLRPNWPNPYVNLGSTMLQAGQTEDAVEQFDRALELDPSITLARYNRATAWITLGRLDPAIYELLSLLDRAPELAANIHMSIGQAYLAKQDTTRARRAFQEALEVQPGLTAAQAAIDAIDSLKQ